MATINPKACSDPLVFRVELLRVLGEASGVTWNANSAIISDNCFNGEALRLLCELLNGGLGGGGGGLADLCSATQADVDCLLGRFDFAGLTPAQITNITASIDVPALDFSGLTPAQVSGISQAALDAGGSPAADAFGVVYGVIFPTP